MGEGSYTIDDLERLLGVRARTIHYWSQEGLFEGPGAGRGTRYTDEHLGRLFLIQRLRAQNLPIPEIKNALKSLSFAALRALIEQAKLHIHRPQADAKQLIRQWLDEGGAGAVSRSGSEGVARVLRNRASASVDAAARIDSVAGSRTGYWQRIPLAPGVELHIQNSLSPRSQALVDRVVALANRLTKEDTK